MKNFYILPLACAIAALSACTPAPVKQEIIIPVTPQPAPQPLVLRKVEPETSAPHYPLNPRNYKQPLNPVIVQQIREALTPKIINPATGEVVTRLPIRVPEDAAVINQNTTTAVADSNNSLNTADSSQAQSQNLPTTTNNSADNANVTAANLANSSTSTANGTASSLLTDSNGLPVAEPQDTQAALFKIDPALKLDEQAVASLVASQSQAAATPATSTADNTAAVTTDAAPTSNTTDLAANPANTEVTAQTVASPAVDATTAIIPVQIAASTTPKILIPIHQQQMNKSAGMPAPSNATLDVTEMDKDITLIEGKARHYPTYFKDKYERWKAEKKIKLLTQQLDLLAVDPRASYEVLLRAMKAHVLARNMDTGPDSAFKSAVYFQRLLKLKPADPETSFWYGFSLGEGGGFRESISHLDTAVKAEYQEAYLALAHSYLQMEDKKNALTVLSNYKIKYPDETIKTDQLIAEIQAGKRYSIWQ